MIYGVTKGTKKKGNLIISITSRYGVLYVSVKKKKRNYQDMNKWVVIITKKERERERGRTRVYGKRETSPETLYHPKEAQKYVQVLPTTVITTLIIGQENVSFVWDVTLIKKTLAQWFQTHKKPLNAKTIKCCLKLFLARSVKRAETIDGKQLERWEWTS